MVSGTHHRKYNVVNLARKDPFEIGKINVLIWISDY